MIESIDCILENVIKAEAVTNNKRKSLVKIEEEILQLKSNIEKIKNKTHNLTSQYQEMQKQMTDKEFELSSLEQRCSVLEKMLSEKNKILDEENNKLEELQKNVWNERESFCRKVRAFTSEYSVSTNFHKLKFDSTSSDNISHCSASSSSVCVINELKEEKARVELELNNINQSEIMKRLSELVEEKENLLKEPTLGKQFLELQQKLQTASKRTNQIHVQGTTESLLENKQKKSQIMKKLVGDKRKRTPTYQTVLDEWLENGMATQLKKTAASSLVHMKEHEVKVKIPVATSKNYEHNVSTVKFVPKQPSTLFLNVMRNETPNNK